MSRIRNYIVVLIIFAASVIMTACAKKPLQQQGPKQPSTLESVAKMKSIGAMIGCMFAPNDPECEKMRAKKIDEKPHLSQEEYDQQNNKDWDKID